MHSCERDNSELTSNTKIWHIITNPLVEEPQETKLPVAFARFGTRGNVGTDALFHHFALIQIIIDLF